MSNGSLTEYEINIGAIYSQNKPQKNSKTMIWLSFKWLYNLYSNKILQYAINAILPTMSLK